MDNWLLEQLPMIESVDVLTPTWAIEKYASVD